MRPLVLSIFTFFCLKNFFKNKFFFLVLAALLFLAAYFLYHPFVDGASPTISDFEQILHKKIAIISHIMPIVIN